MASGTMVSRILGFVRSIMLLAAIGAAGGGVSAAFQTANTLPNTVFNLLASGVFDAVLVPQIVGALKRRHDGETYVNRLLTLAGTLLFVVTLVSITQTLLIAGGFSICGAAAVAAVDGVIETEDREEVVTAVGLVVIFGTLMIPLVPILGALIGLDPLTTGLWAGASTHEVAQVVAIGGAISEEALAGAVVVKLARVLMLAPVMAAISLWRRGRIASGRGIPGTRDEGGALPPIMPLFVFGFICMVALRWTGVVPDQALSVLKVVQSALLASAMFALGAGVRLKDFIKVGPRPFVLAALITLLVASVGLAGVTLAR
ncbi:Uncharacterised protein [Actinomyces bovis]|uniref:Sulfate exporter family transporter n=1 Tax=Actinomyces bovis TaxID=1658 RepID=A0ABY1VQV8_9ACTO|nr:putative sulfate exporter family transporter [Actinomyces bovis]SPT54188.1 Uncharacterised protein [Actinomyces bovis]VEG56580.1 Uncharacterised protein [Actinomyces israelii]